MVCWFIELWINENILGLRVNNVVLIKCKFKEIVFNWLVINDDKLCFLNDI